MNEPPADSSVLGIEAVEWLAEGGENLTVRVTGRWRRRRPAWSAQPTLVIEAPGRRYRFPAIAEPPSLSGAGPGMWRISFAVPAALVPELGGRAWLQFGAVIVPLPAAVSPPPPGSSPPPGIVTEESAATVPGAGETAEQTADPTPGADAQRAELESALSALRAESERLGAALADQQLARRAAEKGAAAERALRTDLAQQLRARAAETEAARGELAALAPVRDRVGGLEAELAGARVELEQARRALAAAARDRAPAAGTPPPGAQQRRLSFEQEVAARRPVAGRVPSEPLAFVRAPAPLHPGGVTLPGLGAQEGTGARTVVAALRQELSARSVAEAGLRSRLIEAEARLAARELLEQRTGAILGQLRGELDGLRDELERERAARRAADQRADGLRSALGGARTRTDEARQAIAEIRGALEGLRRPAGAEPPPGSPGAAAPPAAGSPPAGAVAPDRLSAALSRLRAQIPADESVAPAAGETDPPSAPAGPSPSIAPPTSGLPASGAADASLLALGPLTVGRPWLRTAFRALARTDPDRAGRLLLELLPAQRAVHPQPIAYDLELGGDWGCLRVTVRDGDQEIVAAEGPRSPGDVAFRFTGEPAELGRLLRAGWLRRRLSRRVGRLQGRRAGLAALDALVATQLGLGALSASGVTLSAATALPLLAQLVPGAWTSGEDWILACGESAAAAVYLVVGGPGGIAVTENRPARPAATTIIGPPGTLERVLRGDPGAQSAVDGDPGPVARLRAWVTRAQVG